MKQSFSFSEVLWVMGVMLVFPIVFAIYMFKRRNDKGVLMRSQERAIDAKVQKDLNVATKEVLAEKEEITGQYNTDVKKVVNEIQNEYVEKKDDAKSVNDFLKDVGKQVRGDS